MGDMPAHSQKVTENQGRYATLRRFGAPESGSADLKSFGLLNFCSGFLVIFTVKIGEITVLPWKTPKGESYSGITTKPGNHTVQ